MIIKTYKIINNNLSLSHASIRNLQRQANIAFHAIHFIYQSFDLVLRELYVCVWGGEFCIIELQNMSVCVCYSAAQSYI